MEILTTEMVLLEAYVARKVAAITASLVKCCSRQDVFTPLIRWLWLRPFHVEGAN